MTTVRAEPQNAAEIAAFIEALPGALQDVGAPSNWIGQYGYGCFIHPDLWYKPMAVNLSRLAGFFSQSTERAIFVPGYSDLELASEDGRISIEISHNGFARVTGKDSELVQAVSTHPAIARSSVRLIGQKA